MNSIVVNGYAIDISRCNGNAAPVLIGDVVKFAVADGLAGTNLAEVGGCVGQMGLKSFGREGAADVTIHSNIGEHAVCRRATTTCNDIVKTGTAKVFEAAAVEVDILGVAQFNCGISTTKPTLIVEFVVVGAVNLRAELVGFNEIHSSLQGNVAFF